MSEIVQTLLDNSYQDTQLLKQIDEIGNTASVIRNVDFYLYAPTLEKAEMVSNFINDNEHAIASFEEHDDLYQILAVVAMPTTQNVICSVSGLMACVAEIFGVEYDGWSAPVVKRPCKLFCVTASVLFTGIH